MQDTTGGSDRKGAAVEIACARFADGEWARTPVHVPGEMELTIYVNGQELVTVLCTPTRLNYL
ncbi:MAG: sulfurtransferase FdhD, partial [Bacillota bacterium]